MSPRNTGGTTSSSRRSGMDFLGRGWPDDRRYVRIEVGNIRLRNRRARLDRPWIRVPGRQFWIFFRPFLHTRQIAQQGPLVRHALLEPRILARDMKRSPEPDTDPPVREPEPEPPSIEEPEHPRDPGPAEDPGQQPVRGGDAQMETSLHEIRYDPKAEIGRISPLFQKAQREDRTAQESRHLPHAASGGKARARRPVL